jgi:hypothetical protein
MAASVYSSQHGHEGDRITGWLHAHDRAQTVRHRRGSSPPHSPPLILVTPSCATLCSHLYHVLDGQQPRAELAPQPADDALRQRVVQAKRVACSQHTLARQQQ